MFRPKKSLGQNFLNNPKILAKIVKAAKIAPDEDVLEAGPGEGTLTEALLEAGARVIAVEKDRRLMSELQKKFSAAITSGKFELVHADILDFSLSDYKLKTNDYKLVANIPYYITGAFIRKFLEAPEQPSVMAVLVQKEVAERIVAKNGKESLLSISVKCYGSPRYVETVKAGSFTPAPSVDSAILLVENISRKNFATLSEEKFFKLLKTGFAHKRKRLAGNLKNLWPRAEERLKNLGLDPDVRPENLSLNSWLSLAENI